MTFNLQFFNKNALYKLIHTFPEIALHPKYDDSVARQEINGRSFTTSIAKIYAFTSQYNKTNIHLP